MKIIVMLIGFMLALWGRDLVVFENEFKVFTADKSFNQIVVGNQDILKVSVMESSAKPNQSLRLFGKKSGNTSLLIRYSDNTVENYQIYVNQNLGFIQKMINIVAPEVTLHKAGDGSTVLGGHFNDPHQKKRVYELLSNAGIDANQTMDLSETKTVEKMIRTKLYLVSIDNDRAEELGGAVGLNYFNKNGKIAVNSAAKTYATFSGFLLDQTGAFAGTGSSLLANLNFLQSKGVAKILDDTVLLSTEDQNSSFHVGGKVYIPIGVTYNTGNTPTINLEEKEYGLRLSMKPKFLEKKDYMGIKVGITDSEFDTDPTHQVQLGDNIFVPAFRAKDISTDVVAQSGQVIALGGRLHTESTKQEEKVPLLGDIPVLGHLFKRTVDSTRSNDLLFFLVPEIVDSNKDIDDTGFYKSFGNEAREFHDEMRTKPVEAVKAPEVQVSIDEPKVQSVSVVEISNASDDVKMDNSSKNRTVDISKPEMALAASAVYEVTSPHIYVRVAPKNGKPAKVWEQGHRFLIGDEMTVDNVVWAKITADCMNDKCDTVADPLWISKNHIKQI